MSFIREAVVFGVIAAALLGAVPAHATFPGQNGKIAFRGSEPNGTDYNFPPDIWVIEPNGSGLTNLTADDPAHPSWPNWSADGTKLAYTSVERPGYTNGQIWTMNADGTGKRQVTSVPPRTAFAAGPAWSPDGEQIAYFSYTTLHVINADGSGDRRIAGTGFPDFAVQPSWSPDGSKIAFRGSFLGENRSGLWTTKPDGSDATRICCGGNGIDVRWPEWSPDGRTILFQTDLGSRDVEGFYRINADGSGLVKIYSKQPLPSSLGYPVWSPDGKRIVFPKSEPGSYGAHSLYATPPDFSDLVRLTGPHPPSPGDTEPDWQPIPAPKRSDFKNSNQFCRAEQALWGDEFADRHGGGANAFGKCVSQNH